MRRINTDDLARTLAHGTVSRKRALTVLGGAIAAAVAPSLTPRQAKAGGKASKRCRRKGGVYLTEGTCRCASGYCDLTCHGNPVCHCYETVEGQGFCAGAGNTGDCTTTADCQPGEACAKTCVGVVCVPPCPD
jgi:hypothetical protein